MTAETVPAVVANSDPAALVTVDAREELLNGQEPFGRIMDAVDRLAPGQILLLRTIFEPCPLYVLMETRGYAHWAQEVAPDDWVVYFFREPSRQ